MPAGSHFEQTDITLVWLANACLATGDWRAAVKAAVRLTSSETKVRRYLEPFVVDTVASVLTAVNVAEAATLRSAAGRLRERDGLTLSPAEESCLTRLLHGGAHQYRNRRRRFPNDSRRYRPA